MTTIIYLLALAAIVAPYLLWQYWLRSVKTVYQGKAQITWLDKSAVDKTVHYAFFQVPGFEKTLMERIPAAYNDMSRLFTSPTVTVNKRPFSTAWIEQVEWQEGHPEPIERIGGEGLLITAYYMVLGMLIALSSMKYNLGHPGYFLSALTIAAAGFCLNRNRFTKKDTLGQTKLLRVINVGKGTAGLLAAGAFLAALSAACFWAPSFFMFFPGINCAFELGGITAIIATAFSDADQSTSHPA